METQWKDKAFAIFKLPDKFTDPVIVSRYLPDYSLISIGRIYQDFDDDQGTVTYVSIDNEGEEINPPTTDYHEAENGFEKYARAISKQSLEKEWGTKANELAEREEEITKVRLAKISNMKNRPLTI